MKDTAGAPDNVAAVRLIDPSLMTLSSIMKTEVVSIDMDESLKSALELCTNRGIRHLPVVDEAGALVGILTDRDIRYHLSPRLGTISENNSDRATLDRRVHTVMARDVFTGTPEMSLGAAARKMLHDRVGCLPVVDSDHRVVGVVTTSDFLLLLAASVPDENPAPKLSKTSSIIP
jgi:acetoin utilization protein AcuB